MLDTTVIIPNTPALVFDLDHEFSVYDGEQLVSDLIAVTVDDLRVAILGEVAYALNHFEDQPDALREFRSTLRNFITLRQP